MKSQELKKRACPQTYIMSVLYLCQLQALFYIIWGKTGAYRSGEESKISC